MPRLPTLPLVASMVCGLAPLAAAVPAAAQARPGLISIQSDGRLRFESDVASRRADTSQRDDRYRIRIRGRLLVAIRPADAIAFTLRARTGSTASQQSPHLTVFDLSGNDADDLAGSLDQYFGSWRSGRFRGWLGRNGLTSSQAAGTSFWAQNELFWDTDVTVLGALVATELPLQDATVVVRAGHFGLPDGAVAIRGRLSVGQVTVHHAVGAGRRITAGLGYLGLDGRPTFTRLRDGNGVRAYDIAVGSIQYRRPLGRRTSNGYLQLGIDGIHNFAGYGSSDTLGSRFQGANTGIVFQATLVSGRAAHGPRRLGAWEARYSYARIEKLAVNASYAQDDWIRWGGAGQTDASDFKGHEVSFRAWLTSRVDLHARAYRVRAISSIENGSRFRVDLNIRF